MRLKEAKRKFIEERELADFYRKKRKSEID